MEDLGILVLLCLVLAGYLLYCGAKALLLCIVPVLCALALGHYCLICARLFIFRALRASPAGYVRPIVSGTRVVFNFSRQHLHGLNGLAGVLAGAFSALLVLVVEMYTQSFDTAFKDHDTLKYMAMILAWLLPLCVGMWIRSGGGTNGWYEEIVRSSLERRGLLGSRLISALTELDGIGSTIERSSRDIGIEWETKYRHAVEEYIVSQPEVVTHSGPADAVVHMICQLARNDLNGLRSSADAYQDTKVELDKTADLLRLVKSRILHDQIEKIREGIDHAKQHLLPVRKWQHFISTMEEAVEALEHLRHYASQDGNEDRSDGNEPGSAEPDDYYEVLQVSPNASVEVIKRAFRFLIDQCHPDKHPDDPEAEEKAKRITEAYFELKDSDKRKAYDSVRSRR